MSFCCSMYCPRVFCYLQMSLYSGCCLLLHRCLYDCKSDIQAYRYLIIWPLVWFVEQTVKMLLKSQIDWLFYHKSKHTPFNLHIKKMMRRDQSGDVCHNAQHRIWQKPEHTISTVRHSGGRVTMWACFAATGPGKIRTSDEIGSCDKINLAANLQ